jgi:phage repressor protein C with HTH and peptisase S24 domain
LDLVYLNRTLNDKYYRTKLVYINRTNPRKQNMKNVSERITYKMHSLHLKQVDIYQRIDVSRSTASSWVNGTSTPAGKNLEKLAKILQTTPEWILFGVSNENGSSLGLDSSPLGEQGYADSFVDVPVYDIELSAGYGAEAASEVIQDYYPIHQKLFDSLGISKGNAAIVKIRGDSMESLLHNGDSVLVHTAVTKPQSNKVFAFSFENEMRVKRFTRRLDGFWRIISDNEDKVMYPDEIISPQSIDQLNIIGHVVKIVDRSI